MKIDRACNLVMTVNREDGTRVHVHSMPVALAVFEDNALILTAAWTAICRGNFRMGPRSAAAALRSVCDAAASYSADMSAAERDEEKRAARGVYDRLLAEIHRLTSVVAPGPAGWEPLPFDEAVRTGRLDEEEVSEVNGALVFFMCVWRVLTKAQRLETMRLAMPLWGGSMSSSSSTDFARSLPTSTEPASGGGSPGPGASVPS